MSKFINKLNLLDIPDNTVKGHCRQLLVEIQLHEEFLDKCVHDAWVKARLQQGTNSPDVPEHVDCSGYRTSHLFSAN
jgi:hypothetical protein